MLLAYCDVRVVLHSCKVIFVLFLVSVDSLLLTYQFQLLVRLPPGEISFGEQIKKTF